MRKNRRQIREEKEKIKLLKGCNTDVTYEGFRYHIQTEDWGMDNPYLVSRVFKDGQVLKSIKLSYAEIFPAEREIDEKEIKLALHEQHHQILDLLLSGKLFS